MTVSFAIQSSPITVDDEGDVDMQLDGLEITVKFAPVGVTLDQLLTKLKIQGSGVARGLSLNADAANITITGGSTKPIVVVNSVRLVTAPQLYGQKNLRHDATEWKATRTSGTGAMFSVGVAS